MGRGRIYANVEHLPPHPHPRPFTNRHAMDCQARPRQAKKRRMRGASETSPLRLQRRVSGGRRRDGNGGKSAPPRADKTISVRLTEAELAEFDAQIAPLGLKRNRALRIAARRIAGFLEADAAVRDELKAINRQIAGIATNINQIAHAANRTHDPDYRAFMAERATARQSALRAQGRSCSGSSI